MTTDQCLAEAAALPPDRRLDYLDGMLRGQEVDPIWPKDDMDRVRIARLATQREIATRRKP